MNVQEQSYVFHPAENHYMKFSSLDENEQYITLDRVQLLFSISKSTILSILKDNGVEYVTLANKTIVRKPQVLKFLDQIYVPIINEKVPFHTEIPALQSLTEAEIQSGLESRMILRIMEKRLIPYYDIANGKKLVNKSTFEADIAKAGKVLCLCVQHQKSGIRSKVEMLYKKTSIMGADRTIRTNDPGHLWPISGK